MVVIHQPVPVNKVDSPFDAAVLQVGVRTVLRALRVLVSGETAVAVDLTCPGDEVRLRLPDIACRIAHGEVLHVEVVAVALQGRDVAEVPVRAVLAPVTVVGEDHSVAALSQQADELALGQVHPLGIDPVLHKDEVPVSVRRTSIHGFLQGTVVSTPVRCHNRDERAGLQRGCPPAGEQSHA